MNSTTPDLAYWLAWSHLCRGRQLKKLFDHFTSGEAAWGASARELAALGFQPETITRITKTRPTLEPQHLLAKTQAEGLNLTLQSDPGYPTLLKEIYDAPVLLFSYGKLPEANEAMLAVVGTRAASSYGNSVTLTLVRELAQSGLTIVSGLMRGIDALAHEATLDVGGRTIGVPGTGLLATDLYPREHTKLANRIVASGGAMISEYPPGTGPERHHFPERNRIVAGLCVGTLVIEAPEKSGALITARLALEYNRDVMAVPGNLNALNSVGTNTLLKLGARPITCADDVLDALGIERTRAAVPQASANLSPEEAMVVAALTREPRHVDALQLATNLPSASLGATLSLLELKGLVKDIGGKKYIKI